MKTELEKIYDDTRLDFFVMAVNHLCDIGYRRALKITDKDIESQEGNGLMTKEFCQDLLKTTRDIANAIDGPYELLSFMSQEDIYGNDKRIVICVDEDGMVTMVYGTQNRKKTKIEVVDWRPNDPDIMEQTKEFWEEIKEEIDDETLIPLY